MDCRKQKETDSQNRKQKGLNTASKNYESSEYQEKPGSDVAWEHTTHITEKNQKEQIDKNGAM